MNVNVWFQVSQKGSNEGQPVNQEPFCGLPVLIGVHGGWRQPCQVQSLRRATVTQITEYGNADYNRKVCVHTVHHNLLYKTTFYNPIMYMALFVWHKNL